MPGKFKYDMEESIPLTFIDTISFNSPLDLKVARFINTEAYVVSPDDPKYKSIDGSIYTKNGRISFPQNTSSDLWSNFHLPSSEKKSMSCPASSHGKKGVRNAFTNLFDWKYIKYTKPDKSLVKIKWGKNLWPLVQKQAGLT